MSAQEYGGMSYEQLIRHSEHNGIGCDLDWEWCLFVVKELDELAALRARIAELESQSATLTPRQCNRACFERGWQAAIEAAADRADNCDLPYEAGSGVLWDHQVARRQATSDAITELQPPAACGDCNPLKPQSQAVDEELDDCYHALTYGYGKKSFCVICNKELTE